jgi:hypothetical protein
MPAPATALAALMKRLRSMPLIFPPAKANAKRAQVEHEADETVYGRLTPPVLAALKDACCCRGALRS